MIDDVIEFNGSKINLLGVNYFARRVRKHTQNSEKLIITYSDQSSIFIDYELKTQLDDFGKKINYEDPRWFVNDENELYCSVIIVHFMNEEGHNTSVGYFKFIKENKIQNIIIPDFKNNSSPFHPRNMESKKKFPLEKNWQFFFSDNVLYCFYVFYPKTILLNIDKETGRVLKRNSFVYPLTINYGFVSGGVNPILIGDMFYSFFHTFTEYLNSSGVKKRIYHIGAALFENKFPFYIRKISEKPTYSAINSSPSEFGDYIIFPGSAELENGKWKIFCGKNDNELTSIEISSLDLEKSLVQISNPVLLDKIRWGLVKYYSISRKRLLSFYLKIKK
jgi:hypothetical protein